MNAKIRFFGLAAGVFLGLACVTSLAAQFRPVPQENPLADVTLGWHGIYFRPKVSFSAMVLTVSQPDGTVFEQTFQSGSTPAYNLSGDVLDGTYTYELRLVPAMKSGMRDRISEESRMKSDARNAGLEPVEGYPQRAVVQSGHFLVRGGSVVQGGGIEPGGNNKMMKVQDVVYYDDLITTGSLAVGFDSVDGESFGYDTIKLKENNLQIHFEDTSTGAFPTNDWLLKANDTASGGASYFAIVDVDGGATPFKIEAGAPSNSLYVEDYGRVGFGTSTPYVELHTKDGDSPTLRLDQDSSSGWSPQAWDLCGNETNFFIRDVTNGSKLCFRIQPNTPSNTLCLKSDGKVGIGTWNPGYPLEVETTSTNSSIVVDRTDGATNYINATSSYGNFGTVTNHPLRLAVYATWRMRLDNDNSLTMASGARCTAGGTWTNNSSRRFKENIESLGGEEAMSALDGLTPVKFNYKVDREEKCVGFIAEDVPELVATKDRDGMSPMDVVAVLTKVVQEQQKTIRELEKRIRDLENDSRSGK